MRRHPHALFLVNVSLLSLSLLIATATWAFIHADAQTGCSVPSLYTDRNPTTYSFAPNQTVTVKADDAWTATERQAIGTGAEKWNQWKTYNCSGVSFIFAGGVHFADAAAYDQDPPDNNIFYQKKTFDGGGEGVDFNFGGLPLRAVSANVKIHPGRTNVAGHFVYLGTHELGHTLGLQNRPPS